MELFFSRFRPNDSIRLKSERIAWLIYSCSIFSFFFVILALTASVILSLSWNLIKTFDIFLFFYQMKKKNKFTSFSVHTFSSVQFNTLTLNYKCSTMNWNNKKKESFSITVPENPFNLCNEFQWECCLQCISVTVVDCNEDEKK